MPSPELSIYLMLSIFRTIFLSFGDLALQFHTQSIALVAEHDAAVQRHDGHAVHFAVRHFQSHVCFLLIEK